MPTYAIFKADLAKKNIHIYIFQQFFFPDWEEPNFLYSYM